MVERQHSPRVSSRVSSAPPVGRLLDPSTGTAAMHTDLLCRARHPVAARIEARGEALRSAHLDRPHLGPLVRLPGQYAPTGTLIPAARFEDLPEPPADVAFAWCPECRVATEYRLRRAA